MHAAAEATLGEYLGKIVEYGKAQGTFSLSVVLDEAGDYSAMFNFGREAEDSPMVGGSSLGYGDSVGAVLRDIVRECRL